MPNVIPPSPNNDLEGIPPKLYKLALGASASALVVVLGVIGSVVWRLNADCPAVQRDVRDHAEHIEQQRRVLDELRGKLTKQPTFEDWLTLRDAVTRLQEGRAADDRKVEVIETLIREHAFGRKLPP